MDTIGQRIGSSVKNEIGICWNFVRGVDAGESFDLSRSSFRIQSFYVSLFADFQRSINVDFDER